MEEVLAALAFFPLKGKVEQVQPFGQGHINETFYVSTTNQNWLLQAVNTSVFQQPKLIEKQLNILLKHAPDVFVPHLLSKEDTFHITLHGKVWRLQLFMQNAYAPDLCNDQQREGVVKGISTFTQSMHTLSVADFQSTIPKFHDLSARLAQFAEAVANDPFQRLNGAKNIAQKLEKWKVLAKRFAVLVANGLPLRVCHNDAKAANVLLHKKNDRFARVIDLDTVGPGYVLFDFGDLLRSMLPDVKENAMANQVSISQKRAQEMRKHFLEGCGNVLNNMEIETLSFGGLYMTYLMALRFFTDYLLGDIYYRVQYASENLDRATNQCAVLEGMMAAGIGDV